LGPIPNPQSPIPNPQSPFKIFQKNSNIIKYQKKISISIYLIIKINKYHLLK